MRLFEHDGTTQIASTRVGIWGISIPLPFVAPPQGTEDDPATLSRLEAIMSDQVETCLSCGRDAHVCRAIGCDPDDLPPLAALQP